MPSCVVKSCKNYVRKIKKKPGIAYHLFPKDKNQKDEWVKIIRDCRNDKNWNPSSASTVCSAHFDEADLRTTAKGRRCLVPYAIPKKLLPNHEIGTQTMSPSPTILQVPVPTQKEITEYCRLCASSGCDGKLISLQSDDAMKELTVKMLKRLNTTIDFDLQHLPTTICSACVKALYTAYDFVAGIELAQTTLANITPVEVSPKIEPAESEFMQIPVIKSSLIDTHRQRRLNEELSTKKHIIICQKKKLKLLYQKVRRLQNRNESLKNIVKNLKEKNYIDAELLDRQKKNIVAAELINNLNRKKVKLIKTVRENDENDPLL